MENEKPIVPTVIIRLTEISKGRLERSIEFLPDPATVAKKATVLCMVAAACVAAPDMYEALVLSEVIIGGVAGVCHDPPTELDAIYFDALCGIKAALAKARGEA